MRKKNSARAIAFISLGLTALGLQSANARAADPQTKPNPVSSSLPAMGESLATKEASKITAVGPQKTSFRFAQADTATTSDSQSQSNKSSASASSDSETPESESKPAELQQVVVTGSRIQRTGFIAPTPTTVLSEADLQIAGRSNLGEILADQPTALGRITPSTTGTQEFAGASFADLRGLGASRTLVLIDGRRPVPRDSSASIDLNVIPMGLIDRVEIVTGGASAAYGSDAVSGVVNVIMANKRDGLRMSGQYGDTTAGTGAEYKVDFSYGFSFSEDRGHVILGGNYNDADAIGPRTSNPSYRYGFIRNPAFAPGNGEPLQLLKRDILFGVVSLGGLIVGCDPDCGL